MFKCTNVLMGLERHFGARFQENFYAFIKKLETSSGKKSGRGAGMEFARKRNELVTSEANMENDKKSDLPND